MREPTIIGDDVIKKITKSKGTVSMETFRAIAKAQANFTVDRVIKWLDSECEGHEFVPFPKDLGKPTRGDCYICKRLLKSQFK